MNQQRYSSDQLEIELYDLIKSEAQILLEEGVVRPANVQDFVKKCLEEGTERARICFQIMGPSYNDKIDRKAILDAVNFKMTYSTLRGKILTALGITEEEAEQFLKDN